MLLRLLLSSKRIKNRVRIQEGRVCIGDGNWAEGTVAVWVPNGGNMELFVGVRSAAFGGTVAGASESGVERCGACFWDGQRGLGA